MIIDSHEHLIFPAKKQLAKLSEAGADKAILFSTLPHPENAESLVEIKEEMKRLYEILNGKNTREGNIKRMDMGIGELKDRIDQFPEKFLGFGPVPLGFNVQDTKSWIENKIIRNGFLGIGEFTPGSDKQVEQLKVVFEAIQEYDYMPIWVHTFNPVSLSGLKILMSFCDEYSNVKVIFGHLGGSNWMETIEFAKNHKNVYLDLSAAFASIATKIAVNEIPERCLYSSDAPYGEPLLYRQLIEYVSPSIEITERILGGNICELLDIN